MSMIGYLVAVTPEELDHLIQHPEEIQAVFFPGGVGNCRAEFCYLDKAWHGIHYLLTGTPWGGDPPLSVAILGGKEIGDDIGYGPARYLTPEQVRAVAAGLDGLTEDVALWRCDPMAMQAAEIYGAAYVVPRDGYLLSYLEQMKAFYRVAAAKGLAVLTCVA